MPVKPCQKNGKKGKKYGDEGKCYTGADQDALANRQGKAIEANKHKGRRRKGGK